MKTKTALNSYRGVKFTVYRESDGWHAVGDHDYLAVKMKTKAGAVSAACRAIDKEKSKSPPQEQP